MLTLYYHPLASFCWKALIALYETGLEFEHVVVDLGDPASAAAFKAVWPMGKMPALRDGDRVIAESTIVIEHVDALAGGGLLPADEPDRLDARFWDRVFDHYVEHPMQKIVLDALRPVDGRDPSGVDQARGQLREAYGFIDTRMQGRQWCVGETFSLAECSACPALFYANTVEPIGAEHGALLSYLQRLEARPSFSRVLREAEPYFAYFPLDPKPRIRSTG